MATSGDSSVVSAGRVPQLVGGSWGLWCDEQPRTKEKYPVTLLNNAEVRKQDTQTGRHRRCPSGNHGKHRCTKA